MGFDLLQELGEEKRAIIIDGLVRGDPTSKIARTIQEDWGRARDLSRTALESELTSIRRSVHRGGPAYNLREPSSKWAGDSIQMEPLHYLADLVAFQEKRLEDLAKRERNQGKPLPGLTSALRSYADLLVKFQNLRFDLGLDQYKRVKITNREQLLVQEARERELNKQIIEAAGVATEILKKRRITPARDIDHH